MNERIEELIVAYLHRGATPEQEKELFQACSSDPDIAALLRRHLSLSLTLRQLRDTTEVPVELRNSLLGKINALKPIPETPAMSFGVKAGVFKWRHAFGAAFAGAALAAIGFLTLQPTSAPNLASVQRPDTVQVVRTETVTQYRDVPKIVYVTRSAPKPSGTAPGAAENLAAIQTPGPMVEKPAAALTSPTAQQPVAAKPVEAPRVEIASKPESFTEQYTMMLASLEKIKLSESDRVRY